MIPVQTILPGALAAIVRKAPLTEEKVGFAWRTAVGAAVAGATEIALDGTTLRVRARDRAWQREIERSVATIRIRLDDLLGAGVVRYLTSLRAAAEEPRRRWVLDARRRLRLRGRLRKFRRRQVDQVAGAAVADRDAQKLAPAQLLNGRFAHAPSRSRRANQAFAQSKHFGNFFAMIFPF